MTNPHPVTKHRTQVYFPGDLFRKVKKMSKRHDVSIAAIIRQAVKREVGWREKKKKKDKERELAWQRFLADAGIGKGPKDLSYRHDKYFEYK